MEIVCHIRSRWNERCQPKAAKIADVCSVTAEVNNDLHSKRSNQGWVDEIILDLKKLVNRVKEVNSKNEKPSIAFHGNIIDVWKSFHENNIYIDIGSDQTYLT